MGKLVCGVGISECGEFKRTVVVGGKHVVTKEYKLWSGMLERCYSVVYHQKHPTYIGCSVSEDFKYFQRFAKWCQSQVGFGLEGNHLDKDILDKGNKQYSADICVFVPSNINKLLVKCDAARGEFPIGVSWYKRDQKYQVKCRDGYGVLKHIGHFLTPQAAFNAYKEFKEALIRQLANDYRGTLDYRAFDALLRYTVNIND